MAFVLKMFFPKNIFHQRGILISFYVPGGGFSRNTQKQIFRRISRGNLQKAGIFMGLSAEIAKGAATDCRIC